MKNLFLAVFALLATGVYAQSQPACCQKSGSAAPSCSSGSAKTEASCHDKSAPADKAKGGKAKKSAAKSSKKGEVAVIERRIEIKDGQLEPNLADLLRDLPAMPQGGETRMFFFDSSEPEGLTPGWSTSSSKARLGVVGVENATDIDGAMVKEVTPVSTAAAMGVNVPRVFSGVFAVGAALAGFAGMMAGPLTAVQVGMGEPILILALVVTVLGGIGSIRGAFIVALVMGVVDTFGRVLLPPALGSICIFMLMAAILAWRPKGLFPAHG
jgi:hypothetical protein